MGKKRLEKIEKIIKELNVLKTASNSYAVEKNIEFFEAIKSPWRYIGWLLFSAKKVNKDNILELSDFPVKEWEEDLHRNLIKMERKKIPGMIEPLKKKLIKLILAQSPGVIINLGAGAMELERQIIEELLKNKYNKKITFVAVDRSSVAQSLALENLAQIQNEVEIKTIDKITRDELLKEGEKNIRIIFCKNDIFELDKEFEKGFFGVVCFAKFKHHLSEDQKRVLENILKKIGKYIVEFDDYKSWGLLIPQSIATWEYPILMNGAVFSRIRDYTKKELRNMKGKDSKLAFFSNGSYIIESTNL